MKVGVRVRVRVRVRARVRVSVRARARARASDDELLVLAARLLGAGRRLLREHRQVVRRSE